LRSTIVSTRPPILGDVGLELAEPDHAEQARRERHDRVIDGVEDVDGQDRPRRRRVHDGDVVVAPDGLERHP
jgi:hypothetical protein